MIGKNSKLNSLLTSQWSFIGNLNYPRAFGYLGYLPEPICKENKLFILGGMNSVTLEPVLTTEV